MKFNSKVFKRDRSPVYKVRFYLWHEPGKEKGVHCPDLMKTHDSGDQACFASFLNIVSGSRKRKEDGKRATYNRVYYAPTIKTTKQQATRWIELAKSVGLLPYYIQLQDIENGFVLKFGYLHSEVPPSLIYIYLSMLRHLNEYPGLVRAVLYLVDECKLDVHVAMVFASVVMCSNAGHNFVEYYDYVSLGDIGSIRVPLRMAIAVKRFIDNPVKYDDRKCCKAKAFDVFYRMNAAVSGLPAYMVKAEDLDNTHIIAAIKAKNDKEIKKHMAAYGLT